MSFCKEYMRQCKAKKLEALEIYQAHVRSDANTFVSTQVFLNHVHIMENMEGDANV